MHCSCRRPRPAANGIQRRSADGSQVHVGVAAGPLQRHVCCAQGSSRVCLTFVQPCSSKSIIKFDLIDLARSSNDSEPTYIIPTSWCLIRYRHIKRLTAVSAMETGSSSSPGPANSCAAEGQRERATGVRRRRGLRMVQSTMCRAGPHVEEGEASGLPAS